MVRGKRETTSEAKESKAISNTFSIPTLVLSFHKFVRFELGRETHPRFSQHLSRHTAHIMGCPAHMQPFKSALSSSDVHCTRAAISSLFPPGGK